MAKKKLTPIEKMRADLEKEVTDAHLRIGEAFLKMTKTDVSQIPKTKKDCQALVGEILEREAKLLNDVNSGVDSFDDSQEHKILGT